MSKDRSYKMKVKMIKNNHLSSGDVHRQFNRRKIAWERETVLDVSVFFIPGLPTHSTAPNSIDFEYEHDGETGKRSASECEPTM